jgi:DNA-binding PadR family transcriptional regulator
MTKGNLAYAVLGLVSQRDEGIHCYELTGECQALDDHFWELNYGRVSRVLDTLETDGDLASREQPQSGKPNRKVYRITQSGSRSLDDWLLEPVSDEPKPLRDELSLKLLFLGANRTSEVGELIRQQRSILMDRLNRVTRRRRRLLKTGIEMRVVEMVIHGAELRVRADLAWLDHVQLTVSEVE